MRFSASTGIRIGVFDTWPQGVELEGGDTADIYWADPPFELVVREVDVAGLPLAPTPTATAGPGTLPPGMDSHGLFVAGLIKAFVPDSTVEVYRVLDANVQGNLYALDDALYTFITENLDPGLGSDRAVINLSLGVQVPPDWTERDGLPLEVELLSLLLASARCNNIDVVAAAGNDGDGGTAPDPQIPANLEYVIGVAAHNYLGSPSCFSNAGNIAAPGGDGVNLGGVTPCEWPFDTCQPGQCEQYAVIGPIDNGVSKNGYAYWLGTSFAAPQVSGHAAILLDGTVLPGQVQAHMYSNAVMPVPTAGTFGLGITTLGPP